MQTPLTRLPFHPPTDYYCEELTPIDGQICELLVKRKELSDDNPGFPHLDQISSWSEQYGLNEDWLRRIFSLMYGEHNWVPPVEPSDFLKFVPILKSVEINRVVYAVTHMKQYRNASVVYIETEVNKNEPFTRLGHNRFELNISPEYQCRQNGGYGQQKGMVHSFVVTPPLPDEVAGIVFNLTIKPFREIPEIQEVALEETVTIK
ncbi:hypothetical protein [Desulfitobacterium metallireducens]|uniref:Uncharacterized protein n=1 Tax=Desulfitobacterium metallireducens DSM 15288 TaxID=871968 RepID=W0E8T5_9FIRM|nr:hypothetical protein [Desulfitobacterium metallireducens]AHF07255.1 hypothetical protein DESME_09600 [Desulfitobacterium metallireducens DSM 15288]